MKDVYKKSLQEVFEYYESFEKGLSSNEALNRLDKNGKNKLKEPKKQSLVLMFLSQFKDTMVILLLIASLFSAVISFISHESYVDTIIILVIVFINAILSFIQEKKADESISELNKMFTTFCYVLRDGKKVKINAEDLVAGDIVEIEAGDYVAADGRLIRENDLAISEATLTGESKGIKKEVCDISETTELYARKNMVFAGCNVLNGHAFYIVTATGMDTELGLIADSLLNKEKDITPLQKRINHLSKVLSYIIVFIILLMMIVGFILKNDFVDVLMLSISLAVAAIPEGLSSVITIILSIGMTSMAKKNVIIRKIASVETLGSANVICSDKTGTITQNKMEIKYLFYDNEEKSNVSSDNELVKCAMLCNNVICSNGKYLGDETEIAIYKYLEDKQTSISDYERVLEHPFDSERKMMSVLVRHGEDLKFYTKGSLDSVLKKCKSYLLNGKVLKLDDSVIKKIKDAEEEAAQKSLRILAFAYSVDNAEEDMIFIGLMGMMDPPRNDVGFAIDSCKKFGIRPIMITGDSLNTAIAIGKTVGIISNDKEAILGKDIDDLSDDELALAVNKYSVYARVSPNTKLKIVNELQRENNVVAMTGDGVNDAPAILQADIGIGMGITGTEVVKNVADCILLDDSFATIVDGAVEGRRITSNIKKVILYLLAGNIIEVILVFVSMIMNVEMFTTIQLLWLNLVTDSIPAIMLAYEKDYDNDNRVYMQSNFMTPFLISKIFIGAFLKSVLMMGFFIYYSKSLGVNAAGSLMFIFLIAHELLFAFSCKNPKRNVINKSFFDNKYLNIGMLIILFVQILILTTPLSKYFIVTGLGLKNILVVICAALIMFLVGELLKPVYNKFFKDYRGDVNEK